MKKKTFKLLLSLLLVIVMNSYGQSVSGTVSDEFEPLQGVTVLLKDSTTFSQTLSSGAYSIDAVKGDTLVFIYAGLKTEQRVVGNSNVINVTLQINNQLQEIVVTGQGSGVAKKRLSTKVDAIYAKEIDRLPSTQIDHILQSNTPSAQIKLSSGQSGAASIIRTRGPISANSSTNPVIIVDGIRVDNLNSNAGLGLFVGGGQVSTLADIPVESIDKIEYIKGGAATTLYGADAANGVIQIITKKGTNDGSSSIFVASRFGIIQGTEDFLRYNRTAEALFRTGITESYRVGISGGNEQTTYNIGAGIIADNGYTQTNSQSKKSFSLGLTTKISEKLRYEGSASFVNFNNKLDYSGGNAFSSFTNLESGLYGSLDFITFDYNNIDQLPAADWQITQENIQDIVDLVDITRKSNRFTFSNKLVYDFMDDLKANFTIGLDQRNSTDQVIESNELQEALGIPAVGSAIQRSIRSSSNVTTDLNLTHKHKQEDFTFISILGGQFFRSSDQQNTIVGEGGIDGTDVISSFPSLTANDLVLENANYGLYFLENIGYQQLAFLELGGRLDKNTAAGADANAVFLPKAGISYHFSEHDFYSKLDVKEVLTNGKLRFNYGESTNFATPFSQENTINAQSFLGNTAISFGNPGNDNLTSERVKTIEFGVDLNFLKNRITLAATKYRALTSNALFMSTAVPSSGQFDQIENIGSIENKGWEIALNAKILKEKDQQLSVGLSYNSNQNKVLEMGNNAPFSVGGFQTLGSWIEEGQSLGYLRGNTVAIDSNGNYVFNTNVNLGQTFAPHFGSFNVNYDYKKFNFFLTGDYQFGGKVVDLNSLTEQSDRYSFFQTFGLDIFENNGIPSDLARNNSPFDYVNYFIEDNDFIKIRNIGASYSFGEILKNVKDLKLSFNISNPINITAGKVDPEVTGSGISSQNGFASGGFAIGTQSAPRVYSTAVRFQF